MSEQDQPQREAALDRMMAEGRQLIEQAREAAIRLDTTLDEVCDKNVISDFLESDDCPQELRQMAQEDIEKLMQELEQEEQALASESRTSASVNQNSWQNSQRKSRHSMNKI